MSKLTLLKAIVWSLGLCRRTTSRQSNSPSVGSSNCPVNDESLASSIVSASDHTGHDSAHDNESSRTLKNCPEQDIPKSYQTTFRRGDKAQRGRDIKRLAIAFTLSESRELKEIFVLVTKLTQVHYKEPNTTANFVKFIELCGPFILQLAEMHGKVGGECLSTVISEFLSLLQDLDLLHSNHLDHLDEVREHTMEISVKALIDKITEVKKIGHLEFKENYKEESDSMLKSRIDTLLDVSVTVLDVMQGGCDLIPPACIKPAVGFACSLLKALKRTRTNYQDMHDLSEITSEFVLSIAVFCSENNINHSHTLELASMEFTDTLRDIVDECIQLANKPLISRFLQQGNHADAMVGLKSKLDHAIRQFQLKTQILQFSDFRSLTKIITDKLDGDIIQSLPQNPFFQGSREDFMPDIQDDTLTKIGSWIENSSSPILLLSGSAGLGKTSISHQLIYHLMDSGRLAAQIFFTRGSVMQCNLVTVIQMLAHELASMHPRTIPEIANATRLGGSSHQSLSSYLKRYILAPIKSLSLSHPLVLVLDALDECHNSQLLLQAFSEIDDYTDAVRIFITSRPSSGLEECIKPLSMITRLNLNRLTQGNMERYISVRFNKMQWSGVKASKDDIIQLARLADGLLIWASTSCNFIGNEMQEERSDQLLQKIISSGKAKDVASEDQLANLYHTTLSHLFGRKHRDIQAFIQVFQTMLVVQESMTVQIFAATFNLSERQIKAIHSELCALENYESFDKDTIIPASQRFHASFLEYITQSHLQSQSNLFYIDLGLAHSTVAEQCLLQIRRFSELSESEGRKAKSYGDLEQPVQYAVCHWPSHLVNSVQTRNLSISEENELLQGTAATWINDWAPFYLLASRALSIALEGQRARRIVDKAVSFHTNSLRIFAATGVDQIEAFSDFGFALWKRYDQSGSPEDLESSISMQETFLEKHPDSCLQRAQALSRMGMALWGRFMTPQSVTHDLERAISALSDAVEMYATLSEKEDFATLLALTAATKTRFEETGTEKDLNDTILLHKRVVAMVPPDHIDPTRALNNLAISLISRFEEKNTMSDLDEAISILYDILERRPVGHPARSSTLNNLAFSLQHRFENLGQMSDLHNAISMNYEVLELRPDPHRYRAQTLTNAAICLRYRFEGQGSMADLDAAMSMSVEALKLRPDPHPYHAFSLNRVGNIFYIRFQHMGCPEDLDEAISFFTKTVASCPNPHRDYFFYLNDLGKAIRTRFEKGGAEKDLADAVDMQRNALGLSSPQSVEYSAILNDLGATLSTQYERCKSEDVLSEAIKLLRDACELRPGSHPYRFQSLNDLAKSLRHRFERTRQPQYLDEARILYTESVQMCPPSHPSRRIAVDGLVQVTQSHISIHESLEAVGGWMSETGVALQPNL